MQSLSGRRSLRTVLAVVVLALTVAPAALADDGPNHRIEQQRPIKLGTSGGNINDFNLPFCQSGTLGGLVQDTLGTQYILSNNHVLARTNQAVLGEDTVHPGLIDVGCAQDPNDAVADYSNRVDIQFKSKGATPTNTVDAAIAQARSGAVDPSGYILDIGPLSPQTLGPSLGLAVKKSGRTTGLTFGSVTAVSATVDINYGKGKTARFVNQIMTKSATGSSMSAGGDSGSILVEDVGMLPRAVGLLFAGSGKSTISNPMGEVLNSLGVTMVGGVAVPAPTTATTSSQEATAQAAKSRHEEALLRIPSVVGVGVGVGPAIEVYLAHENEEARRQVPAQLERVPVRVVVTGEFHAL